MNIGDRVRLIHGTEEGIIRRIKGNRIIEIEIEDGFLIPVLKNEVVIISASEKENFDDIVEEIHHPPHDEYPKIIETSDILLAIEQVNIKLTLWLINHTNNTILFSVHAEIQDELFGLSHGELKAGAYAKIDEWELTRQDEWPILHIKVLEHFRKIANLPDTISLRFNLTQKILRKTPAPIPSMGRNGILFSIIHESPKPDPQSIKEALFTGESEKIVKDQSISHRKPIKIDLHIEEIVNDYSAIESDDILPIQLNHFEKKLEEAVIQGYEHITFIHGIGNGSLRNAIHKKLSNYPHIKYFEDAQKEKFGYGATKVYLK